MASSDSDHEDNDHEINHQKKSSVSKARKKSKMKSESLSTIFKQLESGQPIVRYDSMYTMTKYYQDSLEKCGPDDLSNVLRNLAFEHNIDKQKREAIYVNTWRLFVPCPGCHGDINCNMYRLFQHPYISELNICYLCHKKLLNNIPKKSTETVSCNTIRDDIHLTDYYGYKNTTSSSSSSSSSSNSSSLVNVKSEQDHSNVFHYRDDYVEYSYKLSSQIDYDCIWCLKDTDRDYTCDNITCQATFCEYCIQANFGHEYESNLPEHYWICYRCDPGSLLHVKEVHEQLRINSEFTHFDRLYYAYLHYLLQKRAGKQSRGRTREQLMERFMILLRKVKSTLAKHQQEQTNILSNNKHDKTNVEMRARIKKEINIRHPKKSKQEKEELVKEEIGAWLSQNDFHVNVMKLQLQDLTYKLNRLYSLQKQLNQSNSSTKDPAEFLYNFEYKDANYFLYKDESNIAEGEGPFDYNKYIYEGSDEAAADYLNMKFRTESDSDDDIDSTDSDELPRKRSPEKSRRSISSGHSHPKHQHNSNAKDSHLSNNNNNNNNSNKYNFNEMSHYSDHDEESDTRNRSQRKNSSSVISSSSKGNGTQHSLKRSIEDDSDDSDELKTWKLRSDRSSSKRKPPISRGSDEDSETNKTLFDIDAYIVSKTTYQWEGAEK